MPDLTLSDWHPAGLVEEIPPQGARVVATSRGPVAVFRAGDGAVFALRDRCPHKGGPLSEGIVHGHRVTCPLHSWVIELADGQAVAPDKGCAPRIESRVIDGTVWLRIGGSDE